MVKQRNIAMVYGLMIITFGLYAIYWTVKTKRELNHLGASIPTSWLILIPFVNIYWMYKYCEGFSLVKKDNNAVMWFILYFFVGFIMPYVVQSELNKHATPEAPKMAGQVA